MALKAGNKLHVVTRRLFEHDLKRHFVGEVVSVDESLVVARGYVFVFNPFEDEYIRRPELRTRVFDISDSGHIVNVIPDDVVIENVVYTQSEERRLIVTDGKAFQLDVNEFGFRR
jgi:hypothetical protein